MSSFWIGLLAVTVVTAIVVVRRYAARVSDLERTLEKLQLEESRMFDFLHELGSAFSADLQAEDLHRLIVEAALRILDAGGGALYLTNRRGDALNAAYLSKDCPPMVSLPPHVQAQAETSPGAVQNYLRRCSVSAGEGVIGSVWQEQDPVLMIDGGSMLAILRDTTKQTGAVMLAPLIYAKQRLGVLAVASNNAGRPFGSSEFAIFKAISEQAAFALYNAIIYSEASEKRRLDRDLQVAQDIQRILLPSSAPILPGYEISGVNIPASHVSGDYYDYIAVDDHRTGIAIADVSGKGVPASLIMATCRSVLRTSAAHCSSAAEVLHRVNRLLYPDIKEDMFISMAYMVLDNMSNQVTICRAGHDAPLHYSAASQAFSKINPPGMALGIDSGGVFDRISGDFTVTLETNDCLILYTDGVTEALDGNGAEFGIKNMIQSIQASASGGAPAIVARLTDDLRTFVGTHPQNDDITLIVIRKI